MFLSVIITILCSLCIIIIGHHLWNYLKENYSTKKTNYLVGSQIEKYKDIMRDLTVPPVPNSDHTSSVQIEFFDGLKADLEDFLCKLEPNTSI